MKKNKTTVITQSFRYGENFVEDGIKYGICWQEWLYNLSRKLLGSQTILIGNPEDTRDEAHILDDPSSYIWWTFAITYICWPLSIERVYFIIKVFLVIFLLFIVLLEHFCNKKVLILIRCHIQLLLTWVSTICTCSTKETLCWYGSWWLYFNYRDEHC